MVDLTLFQYSPWQFFDTRTDSPIFDTRPDFTIFRYSHWFDPFPVLAHTVFRYSHRFYLFLEFTPIFPFLGTHTDSTLFRYSPRMFLDTHTDSTIFRYSHWFHPFPVLARIIFRYPHIFSLYRYSPGFYHFSVLTLIRPFFGTRPDSFSILARILLFSSTRPDFTIFRYSHWLDLFSVLARIVFRYSHGFSFFRY